MWSVTSNSPTTLLTQSIPFVSITDIFFISALVISPVPKTLILPEAAAINVSLTIPFEFILALLLIPRAVLLESLCENPILPTPL